MPIRLHYLDPATRSIKFEPLPLDGPDTACTVQLRALPGAHSVHVLLDSDDGGPSLRAEIADDQGDIVDLTITRQAGGLSISGPRRILLFPADARYEPPRLLYPVKDGKLDLLFLFDGTARIFRNHALGLSPGGTEGPGARQPIGWQVHLDRLLEFAQHIRQDYIDSRVGCAEFGDLPMDEHAGAEDLECRWVFRRSEDSGRFMEAISQQQLRDEFNQLEYTPGGDFVDALAEAFDSCQKAGWRSDARRLLVLSGDSPGSAVIDGPPAGTDARVRRVDVRLEAQRLHERYGVEILTVYLESGPGPNTDARPFLEYARRQYRSLATLRTYAWTGDSFDPAGAAQAVRNAAQQPALALRQGYALLDRGAGKA